jgi:hypothetical protein
LGLRTGWWGYSDCPRLDGHGQLLRASIEELMDVMDALDRTAVLERAFIEDLDLLLRFLGKSFGLPKRNTWLSQTMARVRRISPLP